MKYRKSIILIIICILVLGLGYWISFSIHPKPNQPLDSPEVYRGYLNSDTLASRVAAMIILAGQGDPQGTKALIDFYSQPDNSRFGISLCIDYLKKSASTQLPSEFIDKLIEFDEKALQLIPDGKAQEHLSIINKLVEQGNTSYYLPRILDQLNNRTLFLKYHKSLQKKYWNEKWNIPTNYWISMYYSFYSTDPVKGFAVIDSEFPPGLRNKVKWNYARILAENGRYKEAIDIWLHPMQDTTSQRTLYYALRNKWNDIPESQKMRLSEQDRLMFTVGNRSVKETRKTTYTRDEFIAILKTSNSAKLADAIKSRIEAGDKDLKSLLLETARTTQDIYMLHYISDAFKNYWQDIPLELQNRIRDVEREIDLAQKHKFEHKMKLERYKYHNSSVPWLFRHKNTLLVVSDLIKLRTGLEAYFVDCSTYPDRLAPLLKPVAYLAKLDPDRCAVSGPYTYYSNYYYGNYDIASPGPDGVWNTSIRHYLLYRLLGGAGKSEEWRDPLYIKCDEKGNYTFPTKFEPGSDIVYFAYDFGLNDFSKN
jgi:hypothetical protein